MTLEASSMEINIQRLKFSTVDVLTNIAERLVWANIKNQAYS